MEKKHIKGPIEIIIIIMQIKKSVFLMTIIMK